VWVIARNTIRSNGSGLVGDGVRYDVRDNLIAGNAGAVIAFAGAGTSANNVISDNQGAGIGLLAATCPTCSITGNLIRANGGSGIALGLDSPGLPAPTRYLIDGNTVIGNAATGIQAIFASSNTYRGNHVIGNGGAGFDLYTSTDNVLDHNVANNNEAGFVLRLSSSGNAVTNNVANSNDGDGFAVVSASSFNTISRNVGHANGHLDARDDGSGTGNVWTRNSFTHTAGL
jgi:parallel beta-helix repeat protein